MPTFAPQVLQLHLRAAHKGLPFDENVLKHKLVLPRQFVCTPLQNATQGSNKHK
jgi:hypothetical protein